MMMLMIWMQMMILWKRRIIRNLFDMVRSLEYPKNDGQIKIPAECFLWQIFILFIQFYKFN